MAAAIEGLLKETDRLRRSLKSGPGTQIQANSDCEKIRMLCADYFETRSSLADSEDALAADGLFKELHSAARGKPGRAKVVDRLTAAKQLLVKLEGAALTSAAAKSAGRRTATDQLIIETLGDVCPNAAAAYSQALADLDADKRESWRGPATDLREALIANATALDAWKDITPLARNEFICWVEDAKQLSTRQRRIRRTQEELEDGQRRPCCWPGCKHRERTGR